MTAEGLARTAVSPSRSQVADSADRQPGRRIATNSRTPTTPTAAKPSEGVDRRVPPLTCGYVARMRRRYPRIGVLEIIVIGIGLVVAVYTGWVIKDVSSEPDVPAELAEAVPAGPSESVQVAPPEESTDPAPLRPFTEAALEARTILIVGDSTGAGPGSWVDLVAQNLSADRRVSLHGWDESSDRFDEDPATYGEAGRRLAIWNLSYQGIEADYPEHMSDLPQPEVVLFNIGHDRGPRAITRAVGATTDAIGERWGDLPVAFVLQNPSVGDEERQQDRAVRKLTELATQYDYPVIDVYSAFQRAGGEQELVTEESRPSADGAALWADVVTDALGAPAE
ncbi:MAG: SGNH/GDSL hydrolase family protein [Marmoricola sp.]